MKIGIDTDGVLTDMTGFLQSAARDYLNKEPVKPEAYDIQEMFDISKRKMLRYGFPMFLRYCKSCPPRENTQKVIDQLQKDGHELFEITARKFANLKTPLGWYSRKMLLKWYAKNGLHFSKIVFCSDNKAVSAKTQACIKHGATIMVEDRPDVAENLAENGITVLLFDAPYNRYLDQDLVVRVHSWDEVYEKINEIGLQRD